MARRKHQSLWDGDGFDMDLYGESHRRPNRKRQARRTDDDLSMRDVFDASMGMIGVGIAANVGLGVIRSLR